MNAVVVPVLLPAPDRRVSALYVDPTGEYPELVADCWDAERDARNYDGPRPVVAHPPCQLWVNFAALNYSRYGGGHNRPGNDGGRFASALYNVRKWGGVLEHPADTNAWPAHGLIAPSKEGGWKQIALALRMGLRGLAERLRAPGAQAHVALLLRTRPAARGAMAAAAGNASGRMVRPEQADALEERRVAHTNGFRPLAD